jgi:C4-dicarboxylate transporter, DctM subunit
LLGTAVWLGLRAAWLGLRGDWRALNRLRPGHGRRGTPPNSTIWRGDRQMSIMSTFAIGFAVMLLLMFLSMPVAVSILAVGGGRRLSGLWHAAGRDDGRRGLGHAEQRPDDRDSAVHAAGRAAAARRASPTRCSTRWRCGWAGLPGGLLHTNIATCALFSATSGSSVATAATVGTIALPALQERNYPIRPALGTLAAGGTLGILIPPSVNLLVYGSLANVSVGQLFVAGLIPGLAC